MSGETNGNGNIKAAAFYKIVAGVFGAVLFAMLAFFGTALWSSVDELGDNIIQLSADVNALRADVARTNGEIGTLGERVDRTNTRQTDQDRRITRIESKLGLPLP